ncbi:helix-turn-helix domain-containing protein [Chitinophaga sp. 212800010-3]|uniref:helix-turn-helix domain-containing protein n=1 Tax=unclassified Chitinophaga TaxID=2619133 RepID=UPI002DEB4E21|nr:AraC-type DNA-binding protein [Chitinophaga sp. 212800010-3]
MNTKPPIAIHKKQLDDFGIQLKPMINLHEGIKIAHRDDHYVFILQQRGALLLELDFNEMALSGPSLCFIMPGQVHRYISLADSAGHFLFVDASLVTGQYRDLFDSFQHLRQIFPLAATHIIFNSIALAEQLLLQENYPFKKAVVSSFMASLMGLIAAQVKQQDIIRESINGQRFTVASKFRGLVKKKFKQLKQVQQYAELLNISPLYLNECIKEATGHPASYWIQQEILLEARRLLYYTTLDVKEIAFELGYEEHAYFSRFFKKNSGTTPVEFRVKNHELSNYSR